LELVWSGDNVRWPGNQVDGLGVGLVQELYTLH